MNICKFLERCWLNFTWFSMVAMNGEEGDRRFKQQFGDKY